MHSHSSGFISLPISGGRRPSTRNDRNRQKGFRGQEPPTWRKSKVLWGRCSPLQAVLTPYSAPPHDGPLGRVQLPFPGSMAFFAVVVDPTWPNEIPAPAPGCLSLIHI